LTDASGTTHDMIMARNPWGKNGYKKDWHAGDSRWTAELKAKVPLGVDPTTDKDKTGIFIVPKELIKECFEDITISHIRNGYTDNWYDALNVED